MLETDGNDNVFMHDVEQKLLKLKGVSHFAIFVAISCMVIFHTIFVAHHEHQHA